MGSNRSGFHATRIRQTTLFAVLLAPSLVGQPKETGIEGTWESSTVRGQSKREGIYSFTPAEHGKPIRGVLVRPDDPSDVDLDSIRIDGDKVHFESKKWEWKFDGILSADGSRIQGTLIGRDFSADSTLTRRGSRSTGVADRYEKREVMVPVRDGVRLHTLIYSPKSRTEPLPFLIVRSPYGWDGAAQLLDSELSDLARDDYFFVFQDIRGRYQSEGQFVMQRPVRNPSNPQAIDEGTDTYDSIDWLLKNVPKNNGRAGIFGVSYGGWLTEMALIEPHPALKAASEQASPADMFLGDDFHHNGAFRLSYGFEYAAMMENGKTNQTFQFKQFDTYDWYLKLGPLREANALFFHGERPTWNNFIAHPNYDDFWRKIAVQNYVGKGTVPNLNVGGWFDQEDFAGPWRIFAASETPETHQYNYLVVGPWNHGGWERTSGRRLKAIDFGSNTGDYFRREVQARWFAHWLKDKGPLPFSRIHLFETGTNQWRDYDEWPPRESVSHKLYLHSGGVASFSEPSAGGQEFESFVSDPSRPVPYRERPIPETYGGAPGWSTWLVDDQRFAESRPDVAVWKTKPLDVEVTLAGELVIDLFASTSGTDSDWIVKLIDAYPENVPEDPPMGGYELMVAGDALRGRFRNGFERPEPVRSDESVEYKINLLSHNHAFRKGHRIMVQVQSTWFPVIDRNPQHFVPNIFEASPADFQPATQRIFVSGERASAIVMPLVRPANLP